MGYQLVEIVDIIFTVLTFAIIGRALISWIDPSMQTPVGRMLRQITEPLIAPIRQVVPTLGMFDISPIVALLLLQVVRNLVMRVLLT
jgi:YggT family protein